MVRGEHTGSNATHTVGGEYARPDAANALEYSRANAADTLVIKG